MSHREYCGAEPPATPAHVHSEMPAPGVQDFRLIAPLRFMSYHARASLTRASSVHSPPSLTSQSSKIRRCCVDQLNPPQSSDSSCGFKRCAPSRVEPNKSST